MMQPSPQRQSRIRISIMLVLLATCVVCLVNPVRREMLYLRIFFSDKFDPAAFDTILMGAQTSDVEQRLGRPHFVQHLDDGRNIWTYYDGISANRYNILFFSDSVVEKSVDD